MNYYIDFEFIEDFLPKCFCLNTLRREPRRHYIDMISIGIVAEDGREYFAVSNEFDLKHVWNKHSIEWSGQLGEEPSKIYWLRENVLRTLHKYLARNLSGDIKNCGYFYDLSTFCYRSLKRLIRIYGKSQKQIAAEIKVFTSGYKQKCFDWETEKGIVATLEQAYKQDPPVFYGYYADYDWVLFCSLFGRMLDLPKGYPMYCRDLKQMADEDMLRWAPQGDQNNPDLLECYKKRKGYPEQKDEHHALSDARWNRELHKFLISSALQPRAKSL